MFIPDKYLILNIPSYGIPEQHPTIEHAILVSPYIKGKDKIEYLTNDDFTFIILSNMLLAEL